MKSEVRASVEGDKIVVRWIVAIPELMLLRFLFACACHVVLQLGNCRGVHHDWQGIILCVCRHMQMGVSHVDVVRMREWSVHDLLLVDSCQRTLRTSHIRLRTTTSGSPPHRSSPWPQPIILSK